MNRNKRMSKYIQKGKDLKSFENIDALYNPPELPKFKFTEEDIRNAIDGLDVAKMRNISLYFYYASKVYGKLIDLMSDMLTFDYLIVPSVNKKIKSLDNKKIEQETVNISSIFRKSRFKQECRNIVRTVLIEGVFYGYLINAKDSLEIQELPYEYCSTSFEYKGIPIIEFNLDYFDRTFRDKDQRELVLAMYPEDIQKAYVSYKNGSSSKIFYVEPKNSMVFYLDDNLIPYFVSIVLDIIRFNNYKAIDEIRNEQEILKLIIQRLPVAKDGTLMFSGDEMTILHDVVATMLEDMPSVDLITSYAEIKTENLQDQRNSMQNSMKNAKENIYAEAGVSEQLMDATGNVALDKSLKSDEGVMFNLLEALKNFFQFVLDVDFSNKKLSFNLVMPELTIYNRQEWFERYLEASQYGYSKLLVVLAMGIEQDIFYDLLEYENDILGILDKLIPLRSSHTSSGDDAGGNPGKGDEKVDDKTIVNRNND